MDLDRIDQEEVTEFGKISWAGGSEPASDPHQCPFNPKGMDRKTCIETGGRNAQMNTNCCGTMRGIMYFPPCNSSARRCRVCLIEGRRELKANAVIDVENGLCHEHAAACAAGKVFGEVVPRDPHQVRTITFGEATVVVNGIRRREFSDSSPAPPVPRTKTPVPKRVPLKATEKHEKKEPVIPAFDEELRDVKEAGSEPELRGASPESALDTSGATTAADDEKSLVPVPVPDQIRLEAEADASQGGEPRQEIADMDTIDLDKAKDVAIRFCKAKNGEGGDTPFIREVYDAAIQMKDAGWKQAAIGEAFGQKAGSAQSWGYMVLAFSKLTGDVWQLLVGKHFSVSTLADVAKLPTKEQKEALKKALEKQRKNRKGSPQEQAAQHPVGRTSAAKTASVHSNGGQRAPDRNGAQRGPEDSAAGEEKAGVPAVVPNGKRLPAGGDLSQTFAGIAAGVAMVPISKDALAAGIATGMFKDGSFVLVSPPDADGVSRGRVVSFGREGET